MTWKTQANRILSRFAGLELRRVSPSRQDDDEPKLPAPKLPAPTHPAGAAVASMFFDRYPRFYDTSQTSSSKERLNLRFEAIFTQNRQIFEGARVLDVGCHDGRWSFAALESGAAEVVGIEARESLVTEANENFVQYGADPNRYRFIQGDIFEVLEREKIQVDVILCLGFLYHTLRYNELMSHFRNLDPRYLIIDTTVITQPRAVVQLRTEKADRERNAVRDRYSYGDSVLSGKPSLRALECMLDAYDFTIEELADWASLIRDNPEADVGGYHDGTRVTARCRSLSANEAPNPSVPSR